MHKKHIFLRVFSKITVFACVFCAFPAWSDTTCNTNFTPIMGNSIQNGTPTPTTPVEVVSVGNKTINLFDVSKNLLIRFPSNISNLTHKDGKISYTNTHPNGMQYIGTYFEAEIGKTYTVNYAKTGRVSNCGLHQSNTILTEFGTEYGTEIESGSSFRATSKYIYLWIKISGVNSGGCSDIMITESFSTPTSYVPYGYRIPGTSIYLDEPLRKVGNYADELRPDGTVIRRVGVKVFDGTENWILSENATAIAPIAGMPRGKAQDGFCTHAINDKSTSHSIRFGWDDTYVYWFNVLSDYSFGDITTFKSWLAQQYANGTPVTVYYPLATEVVENWSCGPIAEIKIATTKFVDDEFAAAEANLAATVQTIESVVSRTIAQTGQIQILQDTKQTRPDESCPANMKCLLVQDEDGTPHWYPIIEP